MKLNLFNKVNNELTISVLAQVQSALPASPPCAQYSIFLAATLFVWPLDYSFTPIPPPFIFPLINQFDRCLVPLEWGLMAGGCGSASHGGVTVSRGWLCQKWKPLDISGTHLQ